MQDLWNDLRYGFRLLLRSPGFTAVAVFTLALGIGANTAIFSVANSVLWTRLPYQDPDRLVYLSEATRRTPEMSVAYPDYLDWKAQNQVFESMAVMHRRSFNLAGGAQPERSLGAEVSWEFFDVLGVRPRFGRPFTADDDRPGASRTVVLSYGLWQRAFGADSKVVGRSLILDDLNYTVIGVMGPEVRMPSRETELWVPLGLRDLRGLMNRRAHPGFYALARRKAEVTPDQVRQNLETISRRLEQQYPDTNAGSRAVVWPLRDRLAKDWRQGLLLLFAAVAVVLLIACANVAHLLLARGTGRQTEMAIRTALGAGRWRLLRQLLAESLLLGLAGGATGLLLAVWGLQALAQFLPSDLPSLQDVSVDRAVLAFTAGASLLAGLGFGMLPAWQSSRFDLNAVLKRAGRGGGILRQRLRGALVVAEMALALTLLISSGLLLRSLWLVLRGDPGFQAAGVSTMQISLPPVRYREAAQSSAFFHQVLERVAALPGVESAGVVSALPMTGGYNFTYVVATDRPLPAPSDVPFAESLGASPDYFRAMSIPLLRGRYLTEQDSQSGDQKIVVDQTLAEHFWPGEDAIGKQIRFGLATDVPGATVVGVVGHVQSFGVDSTARMMQVYAPYGPFRANTMALVLRTKPGAPDLTAAAGQVVHDLDPAIPVFSPRRMEQVIAEYSASRRAAVMLLAGFAGVALVLAAVGLYGVLAYAVSQRTREIGIRMALGARRSSVLRLVVGEGMTLAAAGLILGCVGALAASRLLKDFLFGVGTGDPATFAALSLLLALVALLACYLPARRAASVDPMTALRYE